jgi:hypothetical protein
VTKIISMSTVTSASNLTRRNILKDTPPPYWVEVDIYILAKGCGTVLPFPGILKIWHRDHACQEVIPSEPPDIIAQWPTGYNCFMFPDTTPYVSPFYQWFQAYQSSASVYGNGWAMVSPAGVVSNYINGPRWQTALITFGPQ